MNDLVPKKESTAAAGQQTVTQANDVLIQVVTFNLIGEDFALPILDVREIIRMTEITPVPHAPGFVEGVINLRGQIIPVVDLRKRFNLGEQDVKEEDSRIMVIEVEENVLGVIVDAVSEVLRISESEVQPPPSIVANGIGAEYLKGISYVNERMLILIDINRVFNAEEMGNLTGLDS